MNLDGTFERLATHLSAERLAWARRGTEVWFDDYQQAGQSAISAVDLKGRRRVVVPLPVSLALMDVSADGTVLLERAATTAGVIGRLSGSTQERDLGWFDISLPIAISGNGDSILIQVAGDAGGLDGSFYFRRTDGSPPVKLGDGAGLDLTREGNLVLAKTDPKGGLSLVPTGPGSPVPIERGNLAVIDSAVFLPSGGGWLVQGRESDTSPALLYRQDAPRSPPRPISPLPVLSRSRPSPDGRWTLATHDLGEDLYLLSLEGRLQRRVPNSQYLEPIAWDPNGASFFASETGSIPLRVIKVDVSTGQRVPWRELGPADATGLINLGWLVMTPDGKAYAYGYNRSSTSDLYLAKGLK